MGSEVAAFRESVMREEMMLSLIFGGSFLGSSHEFISERARRLNFLISVGRFEDYAEFWNKECNNEN